MKSLGHKCGEPKRDCNHRSEQDPKIRTGIISQRPHIALDIGDVRLDVFDRCFQFSYSCFHTVKCASAIATAQGRAGLLQLSLLAHLVLQIPESDDIV